MFDRIQSRLPAFRNPSYRRFYLGQFLSLIGTWIQGAVLSWVVYEKTRSPFWLGVFGAVSTVPMLLFSLPAGAVADRHARRRVLILTQSVMMLCALLYGVFSSLDALPFWLILCVCFVSGTAFAFDIPARQAFVIDMVGREALPNAIALNSALFNGARLIGPAAAGLLMTAHGPSPCFFLNAASFLAILWALATMENVPSAPADASGSRWGSVAEGLRFMAGDRAVGALVLLVAVGSVFGFSYATLLPIFAGPEVFNVGAEGFGFLMASSGLGALAGALLLSLRGNAGQCARLVRAGYFVFAAGTLLLAAAPSAAWAFAAMPVIGAGLVLFSASANTLVQTIVPDRYRGRIMGAYALVFIGLNPFGSLQAGILAQRIGSRWTVAIGGAVCVLAAAALYPAFQSRETAHPREKGVPAPQPSPPPAVA